MPNKLTAEAIKATVARAEQKFKTNPKAKGHEEGFELHQVLRIQRSGNMMVWCQTARAKRTKIGDPNVMTLAQIRYRAREIQNEADDHGKALKRDPIKSTLGGYIEAVYAPWVRANRKRGEKCVTDLARCFSGLYAKRLTDITRGDLDKYVAARRAEGSSGATIVRDMNNLRSVIRRAMDANYLRDNPFKGWEKPKVEDSGVTRYLDADEEKRLRDAIVERDDKTRRERVTANDWRRARGHDLLPEFSEKQFPDHLTPMVLVSLNTGLRFGELAGLDWSAVDMRAKVLTVTARTAKGAKTRHIPLNAEALDVLTRWQAQGTGKGLVFTNPDGGRIGTVKTAWLALLTGAEISEFRWHDLRHTFASKLVQRGVDLVVVRDLLGHGDFALTLRYAHLEPKQKADAVARLAT